MAEALIRDDSVVTLKYVLKNDAGEILDQSEGDDLLVYMHGAENIVPGLESALTGKKVGDKVDAIVKPEDGYGEASGESERVPKSAMPPDVEVGMDLLAQDPDGEVIPFWVKGIEGDEVIVTPDHPLAGVTLHFSVEIVEVREATQEEIEHGHPHGPDGHGHGHH